MDMTNKQNVLIDGSKLITEAMVRAGADVFVGYPITPANSLYLYACKRFPTFYAAPDEITTVQWMTGFAAAGHVPVTATSFPGFALMIESINMAFMMELPMVVVLVQRLGPATGTATCGAQGDIAVVNGCISGGYQLPTFSISETMDCWKLAAKAVHVAVKLRTPVIVFTSKEEVMTQMSFDLATLPEIIRAQTNIYKGSETYEPYKADGNHVPPFLPVSDTTHQVRLTASTHNQKGIIQTTSPEALQNTIRLNEKIVSNISDYTYYYADEQEGADILLISYGITASASRKAISDIRRDGKKASLLVARTLMPVPNYYYEIAKKYKHIVVAEENLMGQYRRFLFGEQHAANISGVNAIGKMIPPAEIREHIEKLMND